MYMNLSQLFYSKLHTKQFNIGSSEEILYILPDNLFPLTLAFNLDKFFCKFRLIIETCFGNRFSKTLNYKIYNHKNVNNITLLIYFRKFKFNFNVSKLYVKIYVYNLC